MKRSSLPLLLAALLSLTTACGGGSGSSTSSGTTTASGDVSGLVIADQMALVTAEDSASSSLSSRHGPSYLVPTGGEYLSDEPTIYVFDESMDALSMINDILCSFDQVGYDGMVNQGDYLAMVDNTLCGQGDDRSGEGSDQSTGKQIDLETWTVNSSRASNDDPQIVQAWVPGEGGDDPFSEIRAYITITEGKSEGKPFGIFSMDFAGYSDAGELTMTGNLSSVENSDGLLELMFSLDGGSTFAEQTHAILTPDGSSGHAYAYRLESFGGPSADGGSEAMEQTVNVAFDEGHYLSQIAHGDGTKTSCLDRQNFDTTVWNYNIYSEAGARKTLNGGFSIKYGEEWGWAGYYGLWLPEDTDISGITVTNADDESLSYTVFQGPGRLVKHSRNETTMDELEGKSMQHWNQESGSVDIVEWSGTELQKVGEQSCGESGCTLSALDTPESLTLEPFQYLNLWIQGFGDLAIVVPESGTISGDTVVPYYEIENVGLDSDLFASSDDVTFKCYSNCPKANITTEEMNSWSYYLDTREDVDNPYNYTFSKDDMTLRYNTDPVIIVDESAEDAQVWGIGSSAMVLSSVDLDNVWGLWDEAVFFTWETGPNNWNKYTALVDGNGAAVSFDAPLSCMYDDETYGKFMLDYQGEGQLFGIPFEETTDENTGFSHWNALFSIPDGSALNCGGTTYYTKAMMIEQSMQVTDSTDCGSLTLIDVGVPTNEFTNHNMESAPEVSEAPAVIAGVIQ